MNLPLQPRVRLSFTVPGKPQPWRAPDANVVKDRRGNAVRKWVISPTTGKGHWRYVLHFRPNEKTVAYQARVSEAAIVAMAHQRWRRHFAGPVRLTIVAVFQRPVTNRSKGVRLPPGRCPKLTKPDLTNITKAVEDALTDASVWVDDSQVVARGGDGEPLKLFGAAGEPAHTEITVEVML